VSEATLSQLTDLVLRFRDERNWKQFHTPKDLAINLALEAAEVMELVQWRNGPELEAHLRARRQDLADELADVLHSVLLLAHDAQIDLGDAFVAKMKDNARKYPVEKARNSAQKWNLL
jgi:NTP pyrophosphatase (non-canonical NTP hydrolase)